MNAVHHYRGWVIRHDPPPIPDRGHDWAFTHDDYDGETPDLCGTAPTLTEAFAEIDRREDRP